MWVILLLVLNMGALADSVLAKMDAIDWGSLDISEYQIAGYEAMATGIHEYVDDVDANSVVACTATGLITPPTPPAPYAGACAVSVSYNSADALETLFENNLNTGATVPGLAIVPLFGSLTTWLAGVVANITGWIPDTVGSLAGVGTATFPTMTAQAVPCQTAMLASKPTSKEDSWAILETYIVLGLSGVLAMPTATGLVGTASFAGAGAGTIVYN